MATDLNDLARVLGLEACAKVLDAIPKFPDPAPPDAALAAFPATDAPTALGQMVRRGLEPPLVELLQQVIADDGVARGLLSWDVLNSSLVTQGPDLDKLRADASKVRAVLPAAGQPFAKIDARRGAPLGAAHGVRISHVMRALGSAIDPADTSPGMLDRARNFARILHRSHLSTMASFYLADLFFEHAYFPALVDLVEVLLDRGARDVEALLTTIGDPSPLAEPSMIELLAYVRARTLINRGKSDECMEFAETNRKTFEALKVPPDKAAAANPRPTLAYCEAALRERAPTISFEHLEAIAKLESPWRYAYHVLTVYAASRNSSRDFLATFESYLQSFGNDFATWYDVARLKPKGAEWARGFLAILVRELLRLPHEAEAWKAVSMILGTTEAGTAAVAQCEDRLRDQATLD